MLFEWRSGSLPNVPTSLANKGLHQPCRSGADCQFSHRCQDVATPQSCGHSKCRTGVGLVAGCDSCVDSICAQDPTCCRTCEHSVCTEGTKLVATCSPCVQAVCAARPSCCSTAWDASCVAQVMTSCPTQMCGCAVDEVEFEGHCYAFHEFSGGWSTHRTACQERGTGWDLVSITSQPEQDLVRATATGDVWLGFTDIVNEGTWLWSNGDAATYQNWFRQPNAGELPGAGRGVEPRHGPELGRECVSRRLRHHRSGLDRSERPRHRGHVHLGRRLRRDLQKLGADRAEQFGRGLRLHGRRARQHRGHVLGGPRL
jgi:hypothetical protein